ncbi:MAG: metal ABC transporter ATP-binding protein [Anaerolineae bacterium]|nr:metal ABC transporter ATP-binding protein [Anaerolineae bacterium]
MKPEKPYNCPALQVVSLAAGYQDVRNAIYDVNFSILPGERVGLLGPNGAGKSTLFKALVGLIPHPKGSISVNGQDCRSSHNLIGYVPQYDSIDWTFPVTVRDVVMMGRVRLLRLFAWPTPRHWRAVDMMLERVGMADFRHRQIGQLSGGQRRRVFIARALAQETNMLLLDEPFSGVDVKAEEEIMLVLERLYREGIAMMIATHDLSNATTYYDKLLLLNQTVVAFGEPEVVFTPDTLAEAYGGRVGIFHKGTEMILVADDHG